MKTILSAILLSLSLSVDAASFYVSPAGNNTTGSSWANAWNELGQIAWGSVAAGDTINISGGPSGVTYNQSLTSTANGTSGSPVTIRRSVESGHDGKVTLGYGVNVRINGRYTIFDGVDYTKMEYLVRGEVGFPRFFVGYYDKDATGSRVSNVHFLGQDWSNTYNALSIQIYSPDCTISHNKFTHSGGDDMLGVVTTGNVTIEYNWFNSLRQGVQPVHRDVIAFYPGLLPDKIAKIRYNIFSDAQNDCITYIPNFNNAHGAVEMYGNVFDTTQRDFVVTDQTPTITGVMLHHAYFINNTYRTVGTVAGGTTAAGLNFVTTVVAKNNLFAAYVYNVGFSTANSLWENGEFTYGFQAGSGNVQGVVNFANTNSIAGADGIPFTSDDGFKILAGSAAIGIGAAYPPWSEVDILGISRGASLDAGAYESSGTAPAPPPPAAPSGLAAVTVTYSTITLTWTDNASDETAFYVSRATSSGGTYSDIATLAANSTGHTDSNLSASTPYWYKVRVGNAAGDSANSNTATATTSQVVTTNSVAGPGTFIGPLLLRR